MKIRVSSVPKYINYIMIIIKEIWRIYDSEFTESLVAFLGNSGLGNSLLHQIASYLKD